MNTSADEFAKRLGLPDRAIDSEAVPWVPQGEAVWFKPLRFDLATGRWINLLRIERGGVINRHRHAGGSVLAYVLQGQWHYEERDWVARAGTFVYEPPGDIHTLVVDGDEEMITLFHLEGTIEYLDEEDRVTFREDIFTKMKRYHDYCEQQGIAIVDLQY